MQAACMIALVYASCLHVVILCRETVFVLGAVCVHLLACDVCAWTSLTYLVGREILLLLPTCL